MKITKYIKLTKKSKRSLLIAFGLLCFFLPAGAKQLEYFKVEVTRISDGDSFKANFYVFPVNVRLYGIDTPELKQAHGQKAKQALENLIGNDTPIHVQTIDIDSYERAVAIVHLENGTIVQEELLRNGHAWLYSQYCDKPICNDWKKLEEEARSKKIGLWANNRAIAPWEYRRKN